MKSTYASIAFAMTVISVPAHAEHHQFPKTKVSIEKCVQAALKLKPGTIVKSELKVEKKVPVYEFDIESTDGKAWDIECDALTGKIIEGVGLFGTVMFGGAAANWADAVNGAAAMARVSATATLRALCI